MNIVYPAPQTVSIWAGTFQTEDDFDRCVDKGIAAKLRLDAALASICEVTYQPEPMDLRHLPDGFSGGETFCEQAASAAASRGMATANCALVCSYLACFEAPDDWGGLIFLGSFPGRDNLRPSYCFAAVGGNSLGMRTGGSSLGARTTGASADLSRRIPPFTTTFPLASTASRGRAFT